MWRTEPISAGPTVVFDVDGVLSDATHRQHYLEGPGMYWDAFFLACGEDPLIVETARAGQLLDPSYRDTDVEVWAHRLPCAVEWHPGFVLSVDTLRQHPSFRGPESVELGVSIARGGYLTPKTLGDAARTGEYDIQDLKKVWHYLARFGDRSYAADAIE